MPKRRRLPSFRFSLPTLLILVTIVAGVLGWEWNVVRERKAALRLLRNHPAVSITTAADYRSAIISIPGLPPGPPEPWFVRRAMGDIAIQKVTCYTNKEVDITEASRIARRCFPEAMVDETEMLYPPCHPGCFPEGTFVDTPIGKRRIETIRAGDQVTSLGTDGTMENLPVLSVFRTENQLWEVETDCGLLTTTETQPIRLTDDSTELAGKLESGAIILRYEDSIRPAVVLHVRNTNRVAPVVNLVLGDRKNFVANGFLVRSKPPGNQRSDDVNDWFVSD